MNVRSCVLWLAAVLLAARAFGGADEVRVTRPDPRTPSAKELDQSAYDEIALMVQALNVVREGYVDPTRAGYGDLARAALRGMLSELDPYSEYLDPDQYRELQEETSGEFGGIGVTIGARGDELVILVPIEGTAGWKAGLRSGDRLVAIDGEATAGLMVAQAVRKLRGRMGTMVNVRWKPAGSDVVNTADVRREKIEVPSVRAARVAADRIGYLRITQFDEHTAGELDEAMSALERQGARAFVIDLRFNPGGLLYSAVAVCEMFLRPGLVVVSTEGRDPRRRETYRTEGLRKRRDAPLAVLINHGSASAAEIVCGALRDHRRAVLVGQRTFGKGLVQSLFPLADGSAARLTTARYRTPAGTLIDRIGIEPDATTAMREDEVARAQAAYEASGGGLGATSKQVADAQLDLALALLRERLDSKR